RPRSARSPSAVRQVASWSCALWFLPWCVQDVCSGPGPGLQPVTVQRHGDDDHQALDNELPDVGNADQDQPVGQDGDNQRADQRAPDGANAAGEAGAAQYGRSDRIQLVALPELQP